ANDPKFPGLWRGLEPQKNGLAQAALLCFIFSLLFYGSDDNVFSKYWHYAISILSVFLIIMAGSSTVLVAFSLLFIFFSILKIGELFTFLGIRKFIFITIMVFIFIFSFIIYLYAVDTFAIITDLLEKDLSFTGRTIYWAYLFDEIFNKPIL